MNAGFKIKVEALGIYFYYYLCHLHPLKNNYILNKNAYVGSSHIHILFVLIHTLYYSQRFNLT